MILTNKQEEGLKIAIERYRAKEPYTTISGYAGTGKSTLIKFIISALEIDPEDVAYVAFTGKAASVLRQKGCPNAMTAHKLLYYSKRLPNGKYVFTPRKTLEKDYQIIVADEISMLPKDLWDLLLSHGIYIIACGDPFQIPPIDKKTDNHVLEVPHIFLDEVMRQAQESEIIRLTMAIRNGKSIQYNQGTEVHIVHNEEIVSGMYDWADQILCATNNKRQEINNYMRKAIGRGDDPETGDKIIACRNQWEIMDTLENNALVNGTIGTININFSGVQSYPLADFPQVPILKVDIQTEHEGVFENVLIDQCALKTGKKFLTPQQEYRLYKNPSCRALEPVELNYGYAITGHRAQGSEWEKVMVFEERFPFDAEEHARWLYTACTRASEKLLLVR